MANKVITFRESDFMLKVKDNPLEVYLDVNMLSREITKTNTIISVDTEHISVFNTVLDTDDKTTIINAGDTDNKIAILIDSLLSTNTVVLSANELKYYINRLTNVNAIKNSLNNIFSWLKGERVLNPEFGSDLRRLLYEGITDFNIERIISEIRECVTKWEPRVNITNIVNIGTTNDTENNTVHLRIVYEIVGLTGEQFEYDYEQNIQE